MQEVLVQFLTAEELKNTTWPPIDLKEEFGDTPDAVAGFATYLTDLESTACAMLYVTTPSSAAALQAHWSENKAMYNAYRYSAVLFFIAPAGSVERAKLDEAVQSARPKRVHIDCDVLTPQMREEVKTWSQDS
jgi:hypothetical protein